MKYLILFLGFLLIKFCCNGYSLKSPKRTIRGVSVLERLDTMFFLILSLGWVCIWMIAFIVLELNI